MDKSKHLTDDDLQEIHTLVKKRLQLLEKQEEYEEVCRHLDARAQMLKKKQEEKRKLQQKVQEFHQLMLSYNKVQKSKDHLVQKVQTEVTEVEAMEANLQRLKVKYDQMKQKKLEAQYQLQIRQVSHDFLEKVVPMTQFVDVEMLVNHLEYVLHLRSSHFQRVNLKLDQLEQQKKDLLKIQNQRHLDMVQAHNCMAEVQTQLNATSQDVRIWEQKWTQIQKTFERRTLLLGQIKISILNLFEMAGGVVGEVGGVDIGDTETQLETIQMFIQDYKHTVRPNRNKTLIRPRVDTRERKHHQFNPKV